MILTSFGKSKLASMYAPGGEETLVKEPCRLRVLQLSRYRALPRGKADLRGAAFA
jgi:hypothetical protein